MKWHKNKAGAALLMVVVLTGLFAQDTFALEFNLTKGEGLLELEGGTPEQQAIAAEVYNCFLDAADIWARRLTDSITVNVEVDYQALGENVLGSASSSTLGESYTDIRSALVGDILTDYDVIAAAYLQLSSALDMIINDTADPFMADIIRDSDFSANNTTIDITQANAKALGLRSANHPASDGYIVFTSEYDWDFDRSDGIAGGTFDFTSTAVHEMGHLLGFVSGVDTVDYNSAPDGPNSPLNLQNYRVLSVLDFYRYTTTSLSESSQPSSGAVLALTTEDDAFMSLDAGVTMLGYFASGRYNGDGYQASHWQLDSDLGIMGPLLTSGLQINISSMDLLALDVIGYDRAAATFGDFNSDTEVDADDIDLLQGQLQIGSSDLNFDLNYDELLNEDDLAFLLSEHIGAVMGDADLSGTVNLDDFILLKQNYGSTGAGWATGDFTGDGTVNLDDFIVLKQNYGVSINDPVTQPVEMTLRAAGDIEQSQQEKTEEVLRLRW